MAASFFCWCRHPICHLEVFRSMTIIVSANEHRAAIEALAESSDRNVEVRAADIGDRLEVTFDETDTKLLQVFISILSSDEGEVEGENGSRKGRGRWIGDDAVDVKEKEALKILKTGIGRKGIVYSGDGKWTVSHDAWVAFDVWKKLNAVKAKTNYRGR